MKLWSLVRCEVRGVVGWEWLKRRDQNKPSNWLVNKDKRVYIDDKQPTLTLSIDRPPILITERWVIIEFFLHSMNGFTRKGTAYPRVNWICECHHRFSTLRIAHVVRVSYWLCCFIHKNIQIQHVSKYIWISSLQSQHWNRWCSTFLHDFPIGCSRCRIISKYFCCDPLIGIWLLSSGVSVKETVRCAQKLWSIPSRSDFQYSTVVKLNMINTCWKQRVCRTLKMPQIIK